MANKAAPKAPAKMKAVKEKMTKSQMIATLADDSGLSKKEVTSVMGSLERLIELGPQIYPRPCLEPIAYTAYCVAIAPTSGS